ncbi:MAG: lytic murein transglycosylase [Alphaproteobacteria bacterium]|nr:lytic murein transglycosylase [Alphaproteobacteria bacterium]
MARNAERPVIFAFRPVARSAVALLAAGLFAAACQDAPEASPKAPSPKPPAPSSGTAKPPATTPSSGSSGSTSSQPITFKTSGDATFDAWRKTFAAKAAAAGRKRATIISVLDGLTPLDQQVQIAAFEQPEFTKAIWDYVKSAASPTRVSNGQQKMADNAAVFSAIEQTYATPREIVAAIWGMESSYGAFIGDYDAARAIATQAAENNRRSFYEGELIAMMQLIDDGSTTRDEFRKASWAGAVGQTQFMPSTFLANGQDFDKDGKKDIWNDAGDALATAANYLTNSGWKKGEPWGVETTIPQGFDYSLGDGSKKTVAQWKSLGLSPAGATSFGADNLMAELFLPAGSYGPAFLLYDNFNVIKKYNNADSYALSVGLLADKIAGRPDLSRPWPTNITLPNAQQVTDLQNGLNKLGYNVGAADGVVGRNTRAGLQKFQKDHGLMADGFPTTEMVAKVVDAAK